jgi:outer membrane protein, multidrug efflux system
VRRFYLVAVLALTACAGPRPEAPPATTEGPPAAWERGDSTSGAIDPDWWRQFASTDLDAFVARALEYNTDVAIAATRVRRAEASLRLTRSQALPSVGFGAGVVRERDVDPFGRPQVQRAWSGEFEASYEVDLFGRLSSATASARAALEASKGARDTVRLGVAVTVTQTYVDLLVERETLVVAEKTLVAREESLKVADRRYRAGYGTELDLRRAEAEYQSTAALLPATRLAIAQDEDTLATLLGEWSLTTAASDRLADLALADVPVSVPSQALRHRPDIAEAEDLLIAADRSLDSARAAFMPSLTLTASGGYVGSTLIPAPIRVFALGGSLLAPIFEGGRLRAQQDLAASQRDEAAWSYRKAVLTAFAEVETALEAVRQTSTREQALVAERSATAAAYELARNRYREGYADYLEQLDTERSLLSSDLAVLQARQARLNATIALVRSLGGGWQRSTPDSP